MLSILCAVILALASPALPQMTIQAPPLTKPSSGNVHMRIELRGDVSIPLRLHFAPYVDRAMARIRLANGTIVTVDGGTAIPFQRRSVPITDPTIALPQGLPNPAIIDL
ncbi:MAG TPA: hypothetical protein VFN49_05480, partial [Candidatus Aquilonibacter sp.]|nr:hypothetical protein [Candidatus Aquilonibacter sp.]